MACNVQLSGMAASISLILNGTLLSFDAEKLSTRPLIMATLSSVRFLMSTKEIRPTTKHKQVSHKSKVGIFNSISCQYVQFFLCQELPLLWSGSTGRGKRISLYLAVVVCCRDDMLQWYGVYPNGRLRESMTFFKYRQKSRMNSSGKLIQRTYRCACTEI